MPSFYTRVFALGTLCGLRSMMGPALVSGSAPPRVKLAFRLLAAGELIGDKLPKTPSRIAPGPLLGRALSGAGVGYVLAKQAKESPLIGVLLGVLSALFGSYAGYYARKTLGTQLHVPDAVVASVEDALALTIGRRFAP